MASKDYTLDQALSEIEFLKNQWVCFWNGNIYVNSMSNDGGYYANLTTFIIPKTYTEMMILSNHIGGISANSLVINYNGKISDFTSIIDEWEITRTSHNTEDINQLFHTFQAIRVEEVNKDNIWIFLARIGGGVLRALQRLFHFISGGDVQWQALI